MEVTFGKHKGSSVEFLVLKQADYVTWLLEQTDAYGALQRVRKHAKGLILSFDAKRVLKKCYGRCDKVATYCTVYSDNVLQPYWWCDTCDPYQSGASRGKLHPIRAYEDALGHASLYCRGRRDDYRELILEIARAKGLPDRVGEAQARAFFS